MSINGPLHIAILQSGLRHIAICHRIGITPWRLSRIIHGVQEATPEEKKALAKILKTSVRAIFADEQAEVAS